MLRGLRRGALEPARRRHLGTDHHVRRGRWSRLALAAGDFNGDGRDDVAVVATDITLVGYDMFDYPIYQINSYLHVMSVATGGSFSPHL